jgi:hypothetical protein
MRRPALAPWTADDPPGHEVLVPHELRIVFAAAVYAVRAEGLQTIERDEQTGRFILADRHATAWSWGEVVGIYLRPLNAAQTAVRVASRRRLATNVTATDFTEPLITSILSHAHHAADLENAARLAEHGAPTPLPPIVITP